MFLGHYGVALASKRIAPRISIGSLVFASLFIDLIWPIFLLAGIEHVTIAPGITVITPLDFQDYPISHSLLAVVLWGGLLGIIYYMVRRSKGGAFLIGVLVVSHWGLDLLVHRPDLPLTPLGGEKYGLGLWNSHAATIALEYGLLAVGAIVYATTTRARDWIGSWVFWGAMVILAAIYVANLVGPPPPNTTALAVVALAQWLFVLLFVWIDRHRRNALNRAY